MRRSDVPSKRFIPPGARSLFQSTAVCSLQQSSADMAIRNAYKSPLVIATDYATEPDLISEETSTGPVRGEDLVRPSSSALPEPKPARYFEVVWCKVSTRKHKKWEGDALLVTDRRSVVLTDVEGRTLARNYTFKITEVNALCSGSHIIIGSREVEILNEISAERYGSGREHLAQNSDHPLTDQSPSWSVTAVKSVPSKPFKPLKMSNVDCSAGKQQLAAAHPLFNPLTANALVMPDPPTDHQTHFNRHKLHLTKVVVDPRLSQQLRPHQRDGVLFLYRCIMGFNDLSMKGAILADEMGLGKSLQAIAIIWTLLKQGPYGMQPLLKRVLLVCPCSLIRNWQIEFRKWLGDERLKVVIISKASELKSYEHAGRVYPVIICSYEMALRIDSKLQSISFDLLVCDEAHRLKNSSIKTNTVLAAINASRRILLTGTPVQNDLQELFALMDFANPGILGSARMFRRVFSMQISEGRECDASEEKQELAADRLLQLQQLTVGCLLRRTSHTISQYLPSKTEYILLCRPSPLQVHSYGQVLNSICSSFSHMTTQHLAAIDSLRKISNHPVLWRKYGHSPSEQVPHLDDSARENVTLQQSGKLCVLFDILFAVKELWQKVVVVSNFTKTLDLIEHFCASNGLKTLRLDGQTPASKRQENVARFNSPLDNSLVFLLSCKAGGLGLNLIGGNWLILYDNDWNPSTDLQALARIWRPGQNSPCHIYRLITTGTIEEKIFQRQIKKTSLTGSVVDNADTEWSAESAVGGKLQFSEEELRDIFSLSLDTDCNTHDLMQCQCGGMGLSSSAATDSLHMGADKKSASLAQLCHWEHYNSNGAARDEMRGWAGLQRVFPDQGQSVVSFAFRLFTSNVLLTDKITSTAESASKNPVSITKSDP